jgi:hypothetical protein
MKRTFAPILVLILAGNILFARQSPGSSWKEYVYPDDAFAITLPAAPNLHKDPTHPSMFYTLHPTSDIVMGVMVESRIEDCQAAIASFRSGMSPEAGPSRLKNFSANGHNGFEYEGNGQQGDKVYARYFCVNGKFYTLTATWPVDDPKPAVVPRIMDSFRILNPGSNK